jgi:hypothetical protein
MDLPKNLKDEIWEYCRINDISNIDEFTLKLVKQGFSIEKYGIPTNKVVEKEVERVVEIPVEKIIEKIIEVPVADSKAYDELNLEYGKLKQQNEELIKENTKLKTEKDIYGES